MINHIRDCLLKRKAKYRAVCQITPCQDRLSVGRGCLVYDPKLKEGRELSEYFIVTTTKVISDVAGEYEVEFSKETTSKDSKTFNLKSITKAVRFDLASGLVVVFIDPECSQLNHGGTKCSILTKSIAKRNQNQQFCLFGKRCYRYVESNGEHMLLETNDNSTVESTHPPEKIPNGLVILQKDKNDENEEVVGILNVVDYKRMVISPIWLESSIQATLGRGGGPEDEPRGVEQGVNYGGNPRVNLGTDQVIDAGADLKADPGADLGVHSGSDPKADQGESQGVDQGIDSGVNLGADPRVTLGTGLGVDPGAEPGADQGIDAGVDLGADPRANLGTDSGVDLGAEPGADKGIDSLADPRADHGMGSGADPGANLGTDHGVDPGADLGADPRTNLGADSGVDLGAKPGADQVANKGIDQGINQGADPGADPGVDTGADQGINTGADPEPGAEQGADPGVDTGADQGINTGADLKPGAEQGADPGVDTGADQGINTGADLKPGADPGADQGIDSGLYLGADPKANLGIDQGVDSRVDPRAEPRADPEAGPTALSETDFKALLERIRHVAGQCFENVQRVCTSIEDNLSSLELNEDIDFCSSEDEVDWDSQKLLPQSKTYEYFARKTTADGNCFFRAASLLAFGNENRHEEMRVRILVELAVHNAFYLNDNDICRRIAVQEQELLPSVGKITSEMNIDLVKTVLENEVRDTAHTSSWASYWHLQALGAVLNCPVQSVYPECGGSEVRKYFDAVIRPRRCDPGKKPISIMWTQIGGNGIKFVPNHFVPLISARKRTDVSKMEGVEHTVQTEEIKNILEQKEDNEITKKPVEETCLRDPNLDSLSQTNIVCGRERVMDVEDARIVQTRERSRRLTKVTDIPRAVYSQVCLKLNIKDDLWFKDFRLLGEKLGYSKDVTSSLEQKKTNATDKLFQMWCKSSREATVERLIELLEKDDFQRIDVVGILLDWVKKDERTRLSTKVIDIPYAIYSEVCLKLNIKDQLSYKDFRMLGEKLGYERNVIDSLEQGETNPTDELLQKWCNSNRHDQATVKRLIELLEEDDLGRMDVVEILENWVKEASK